MANKLLEPTKVIIPVSTAIERTTNWRNFLTDTLAVQDSKMVPKAVYISRTDIEDLAASCRADETLLGVRAYFTLNTPEETVKNEVKFVMVLVRENADYPFGEDVIYKPGLGKDGVGDDDDSNVYDFTRPCPDCCDTRSPLFDGDQP